MQISGSSSSYSPYGSFEPQASAREEIQKSQPNESSRALDKALDSRLSDPDGNPYYQDPLQIQPGLARFGYVTGQQFDTGLGSERAQGVSGLNAFIEKNADKPGSNDEAKAFAQRDSEVRSHEMAHLAAAGSLARGGMQLQYQVGPDGKAYAVGGSVQIDTSEGATPEETLQKAQKIISAATAPAEPSPQDLRVAAEARAMMAKAQSEISEKQRAQMSGGAATAQAAYAAGASVIDPSKLEGPVTIDSAA